MMPETIAKEWFEIAYDQWLYRCDYSSNLREPTRRILTQMYQAIAQRDHAAAEQLMMRLQGLSSRFAQDQMGSPKEHFYEMAETLVECGRAMYMMGERLTALHLLDEAATKYRGNDHCGAAVRWMMGCIQWRFPTKLDDAIVEWESSLEMFSSLQSRSNRVEVEGWYQYWRAAMQSALEAAIAGEDNAPPIEADWPVWPGDTSKSKSSNRQETKTAKENPRSPNSRIDVLRSFAVYASIPAGGFAASPEPVTYTELERFCIEGSYHYILNLREGKTVTLRPNEEHVAVRVRGKSMNEKEIQENDYVLLRVQSNAQHGDIVAVELDGDIPEDEKSTLKQFFRRDGKVILEPKSTEKYETFVFDEKDPRLHIRGVAIAVFKKLPERKSGNT